MSWIINTWGKPHDVFTEVMRQAAAQVESFPSEAVKIQAVTAIKAAIAFQNQDQNIIVVATGGQTPTGIHLNIDVHPIAPPIAE